MPSTPAAALAALLLCTTAHAQPHISVKARAWIDGLQGHARGQAVTLTGTLRDDLGQPVPGARLLLGPGHRCCHLRGRKGQQQFSGTFSVVLILV